MTYNLENLFDTQHDVGKEDWTYLPKSFKDRSPQVQAYCQGLTNEYYQKTCFELDWSEKILDAKIHNLSQVIREYNNGAGADILVFQEVENKNVLKLLKERGLKGLGYKSLVLVEGLDKRGIDLAIMSKLSLFSKKLHKVSMYPYSNRQTRGVLEATFRINRKKITVFANHWPSQANPDGTRMNAAKVLVRRALKSRSDIVIAAGDFNTTEEDEQNALHSLVEKHFVDVEVKGRAHSPYKAPGTHWYRGHWESLDKIFVMKKSLRRIRGIKYDTFRILYEDFMLRDLEWTNRETGEVHLDRNIPHRFNSRTGEGFSDHLPVGVTINL